MPKVELQPKDSKMLKKIDNVVEGTNIVQRQLELTRGHWDFVVFGANKSNMIIREGYAQHVRILESAAYIVSVAGHGDYAGQPYGNIAPIPIEELVEDVVPEELKGLEVLSVDPLRPLSISLKKTVSLLKGALDFKNFSGFGTIPRGGLQSAHYKGPPEGIAGVLKC